MAEGETRKPANEFEHSVTRRNTVKHWVLYTLDAVEADHEPDAENESNPARVEGVYPSELYEFAAGDDSIVFKNEREIASVLSEMARNGSPWVDNSRPVNRRTNETVWGSADVKYRYRLNDYGRKVLLDLGIPDKLPNRRDLDEDDRLLGVKPAHEPGWWEPEYEHFSEEWDITADPGWEQLSDRLYVKDDGDKAFIEDRGYASIGERLTDIFPDVTFVLTCGPYRHHDLMYAIRDPWRKVVQIDIYSPMALHRSTDEISMNIEALVADLRKGLETVTEEYANE